MVDAKTNTLCKIYAQWQFFSVLVSSSFSGWQNWQLVYVCMYVCMLMVSNGEFSLANTNLDGAANSYLHVIPLNDKISVKKSLQSKK